MIKGRLNKAELSRVAKIWIQLDEMIAEIPTGILSDDGTEAETLDVLSTSRNKLGDLLRWQDHSLWLQVKGGGK